MKKTLDTRLRAWYHAIKGGERVAERNIAIRVDEELFKRIKSKLAENGMTLKNYITCLVEEDLRKDVDFNLKAVPAAKSVTKKEVDEAQKVLDFVNEVIKGIYRKEKE